MDRLTLDAFRERYGDIRFSWSEGDWWILRWIAGIVLIAVVVDILIGEQTFAAILRDLAAVVVALVVLAMMQAITPRRGGVRIDAKGVRVLPKGPRIPPAEIRDLRIVPRRDGGLSLLVQTTGAPRGRVPFRYSTDGDTLRLRLPRDFAGQGAD